MDREKVLFATHQLFGTAANWWETYCTWGTTKLKKKEFTDLKQGGITVNEYLNSFIQLSRYATKDINTDE
jgi:hypothetical protein